MARSESMPSVPTLVDWRPGLRAFFMRLRQLPWPALVALIALVMVWVSLMRDFDLFPNFSIFPMQIEEEAVALDVQPCQTESPTSLLAEGACPTLTVTQMLWACESTTDNATPGANCVSRRPATLCFNKPWSLICARRCLIQDTDGEDLWLGDEYDQKTYQVPAGKNVTILDVVK